MKSRILDASSVILFVIGIVGVVVGLMDIFNPGFDTSAALLGVTSSQISAFSPHLMEKFNLMFQFSGLYLTGMALFFFAMSMKPYRKGEKWAWYSMLIIGGIGVIGQATLGYINSDVAPSFFHA